MGPPYPGVLYTTTMSTTTDGVTLDTTRESSKSGTISCACLDGPIYFLVPTPSEKTGGLLDSASLVTLTAALLVSKGSASQLGEYWLHGYFGMGSE